jgi:hypothetical protein
MDYKLLVLLAWPAVVLVLGIAWIYAMSRGRRAGVITISGFGVKLGLTISRAETTIKEQQS